MKFEFENSVEVKDKIRHFRAAILPIGAVEAHGPHLPLGTDNLLATRLADRLAERTESFVLPTLPYGQVWSLRNFPGVSTSQTKRSSDCLQISAKVCTSKDSAFSSWSTAISAMRLR